MKFLFYGRMKKAFSVSTVLIFIVAIVAIWFLFNRKEGFDDDINPKYANKFQTDSKLTSSRFLVTADPPLKVGGK